MDKTYSVYLLASRRHGTLYCGVTSNIHKRVAEHRDGTFGGFTAEFAVDRLVWVEHHERVDWAILREKRIKRWRRDWKVKLIEGANPDWDDLGVGLGLPPLPARPKRPFRSLSEGED